MSTGRRGWADRITACVVDAPTRARAAACTGLTLTAFAILHCAAIACVPAGAGAFDPLATTLRSATAVHVVEVVLAVAFAVHGVLAVGVVVADRALAPDQRRLRQPRLLIASGVALAGFLVWHLTALRFGVQPDADGTLAMHGAVIAELRHPARSLGYALAGALLGLHVAAGLRVSLDTLRPQATGPLHAALAGTIALALMAGYVGVPLWVWLSGA